MSGLQVIIAEDDLAMQSWLKAVLERAGISVRLASSGWELLSLLSDHETDLVISDVRMPLPYGLDALAMARTAGVTTPFVMITSFADDALRERAQLLDASVLAKPFLASQLIAEIDVAIREPCRLAMFRKGSGEPSKPR